MKRAAALIAALLLGGCITGPPPPPGPSFDTLRAIRAADFPAVAVGAASVAPGVGRSATRVVVRGSSVSAPKPGNFGDFLGETLKAELRGAGRYDAVAPTTISVLLIECRSGENMKTGTAAVAATFIVTRGGQRVFTRDYRVTREWQSYFMAMQAVPAALDGFTSLFPKLVEKALSDPELVRALRA